MKANGITADHLDEQEAAWEEAFGDFDFWPQEYQALNCLLQITEEDLKELLRRVGLLIEPESPEPPSPRNG